MSEYNLKIGELEEGKVYESNGGISQVNPYKVRVFDGVLEVLCGTEWCELGVAAGERFKEVKPEKLLEGKILDRGYYTEE